MCAAGGGDVKIESHKVSFREKAQSKVGSMDNVSHSPGGGNVKVRLSHTKSVCTLLLCLETRTFFCFVFYFPVLDQFNVFEVFL